MTRNLLKVMHRWSNINGGSLGNQMNNTFQVLNQAQDSQHAMRNENSTLY